MKKLIIAAAIVCAAAFANAATAVWGVGYITDVDGNALSSESTGYTATFNIYSDATMMELVTSATVNTWEDGFADGGETENVLNNIAETTYYGQIVIGYEGQTIKSDAFQFTTSTMADYVETFVMTATDEITGIEKVGGGEFDGEFGAFETSGGAWPTTGGGSVPEPTSGLLLLVGAAALALRRKQA